jgi:hypothetical protein
VVPEGQASAHTDTQSGRKKNNNKKKKIK